MNSPSSHIGFQRLLVPVDLSRTSAAPLPFALHIARQYSSKLLIVHVLPEAPGDKNLEDKRFHDAVSTLIGSNDDYETIVQVGNVRELLPALIAQSGSDLVVMATHGSHGVEKLIGGSGAQEIMCSAAVPVLAIGAQVTHPPSFQRILYATDFSTGSEAALRYAVSFAKHFGGSLVLLHVNEWRSKEPPAEAQHRTLEYFRTHVLNTGLQGLDARDVLVRFGAGDHEILAAAAEHAIDLIVMGIHCKHGIMRRLSAHLPGPISYDVMWQAPCAVLTVPVAT